MTTAAPRSAPAGSRRFWVTVLCFAVANAGAWAGYARYHGRGNLLEVQRVLPVDSATVSGRPTTSWAFNLDVAPTAGDARLLPGAVADGRLWFCRFTGSACTRSGSVASLGDGAVGRGPVRDRGIVKVRQGTR